MEDVKEGVIASKIAAHAADIAKGVKGAIDRDIEMAKARKRLDWEAQINLSVDPEKARRLRTEENPLMIRYCSMCGEYCAIKVVNEYLKNKFIVSIFISFLFAFSLSPLAFSLDSSIKASFKPEKVKQGGYTPCYSKGKSRAYKISGTF